MSGTSLSSLFSFSWVSLEAPRQKQWQNRRVYPGLWMPQMKNKAGGKPRVHQEQCVSGANLEREERDKSTSLQVLFLISCWVVSDSLWPCGLQHTRLPCPSLYPGVCSDSYPSSWWCHPTISSPPSVFSLYQHQGNESALCIRWPKYWHFSLSISPSNEYLGLISFRIDWFDLLCCPRDSQESSPTPQFESINSLVLSFLYGPIFISIHDY